MNRFSVLALIALAPLSYSQRPAFEAASIKPNTVNGPGDFVPHRSGTLIRMHNTQPFSLIYYAYGLTANYQVVGYSTLPASLNNGWFDFDARTPDGATDDQVRLMLQSLLEDRFKLKVHREKKEMATYDLTLAKGRPKLIESDDTPTKSFTIEDRSIQIKAGDCSITGWKSGNRLTCHAAPISKIVEWLSGTLTAPVIDHTGLTGTYDAEMRFADNRQLLSNPDNDAPTLETAVQSDLGLKLTKGTGSVEVLVIDHMEMPSAN